MSNYSVQPPMPKQIDDELRVAMRLTLYPSPMPLPEHPDVKVTLDKIETIFHRYAQKMVLAELKRLPMSRIVDLSGVGRDVCTQESIASLINAIEKELNHE